MLTNLKHILFLLVLVSPLDALAADAVLVEAESFDDHGGWVLDTQFIDNMGSPYLLAHGMGRPLADATTEVKFPSTGEYHVFVRTKDWVARWDAPGQPGKFQLRVDGKPLAETFGYATDLRSMTQGQGVFSMELACYRQTPRNIQEEIVAERKQAQLVGAK